MTISHKFYRNIQHIIIYNEKVKKKLLTTFVFLCNFV